MVVPLLDVELLALVPELAAPDAPDVFWLLDELLVCVDVFDVDDVVPEPVDVVVLPDVVVLDVVPSVRATCVYEPPEIPPKTATVLPPLSLILFYTTGPVI